MTDNRGTTATRWLKENGARLLVHLGALLPLAWLAWRYVSGAFLIGPVTEITAFTGRGALILLLLSLSCTPLAALSGWRQIVSLRRALGLYAFVYVSLHFLTFVGLDYGFELRYLPAALLDQRYILAGLAAGLLLLLLTLTSTRGWQRRLGPNWKRLHRLVYLAAILDLAHFFWLVKDITVPLPYALWLALLLLLRLPPLCRLTRRGR